jgi:hypothetical protein
LSNIASVHIVHTGLQLGRTTRRPLWPQPSAMWRPLTSASPATSRTLPARHLRVRYGSHSINRLVNGHTVFSPRYDTDVLCCSMYFLCCYMYFCVVLCIFCVVLCIFCVVICTFVLLSVLFCVCICVLYYCHRVAIQWQLNISHHIIILY